MIWPSVQFLVLVVVDFLNGSRGTRCGDKILDIGHVLQSIWIGKGANLNLVFCLLN